MREGDWGEVVRLMREEREGPASMPVAEPMPDSGRPMPFHERFDTVRITPQKVADSVVEENGRFKALSIQAIATLSEGNGAADESATQRIRAVHAAGGDPSGGGTLARHAAATHGGQRGTPGTCAHRG